MGRQRKPSSIIISVSSDIGTELARRWAKRGWDICGTYRKKNYSTEELYKLGVKLVHCDLIDTVSVKDACLEIRNFYTPWDYLILAAGSLEPVGAFVDCAFDEWAESIRVNFTSQLRIVQELIPIANHGNKIGPLVLFFAGGGTNSATENYSAYTISKIGLVKMCELLDAEIPDTRFAILGPGWVKTKIHEETLRAGERAGSNYQRTIQKLASEELVSMNRVLDFCDWAVNAPREVIGGRNFSVVHDPWATDELAKWLIKNTDAYKLRRLGNDGLVE